MTTPRCTICEGYVSHRCKLCAGSPEDVTLEDLARGVRQVETATEHRRLVRSRPLPTFDLPRKARQ